MLAFLAALVGAHLSLAHAESRRNEQGVNGSDASSLRHRIIPDASPRPLAARAQLTSDALAAFTDDFVQGKMRASGVAGLVVSVVKDGGLLFSKGYGYADLERRVPATPGTTLFRIGSVSKLFTATAAMQLVEAGKLGLDEDVNAYLADLRIPDTFPQPVTLRHLLTHTAGFEQRGATAIFVDDASKLVPLSESLRRHLPARVWPPGDATSGLRAAYSNWGMALAGHMVERASGMDFDQYVERNIFAPLGMSSSTFREPLPPPLAANLSQGYRSAQGELRTEPFVFVHNFAPAGSMSSTANDMANFMIAHLQNGRCGGQRILQDPTARLMHSRLFSPNPYLNGAGLGFYETYLNGHRLIGHGGAALSFFSQMALLPANNIGVFVSVNTGGGAEEVPLQFVEAFMNEYFPAELPALSLPDMTSEVSSDYIGTYRATRRGFTTNEKLLTSLRGEIYVERTPTGALSITRRGRAGAYAEVRPAVFRRVDKDEMVAFTRDANGVVNGLIGPSPAEAANKLEWYETTRAWFITLGISSVLLLTGIGVALRGRQKNRNGPRLAQVAHGTLGLLALTQLVFLALLWVTFSRDSRELTFNWRSPLFNAILALPLLATGLTVLAAALGATAWRRRYWTLPVRLHYSAVVAAGLLILWILKSWNLIGYNF